MRYSFLKTSTHYKTIFTCDSIAAIDIENV